MKRIILAGASLNSANRGVNALTRGEIKLILDKVGKDTEIKILSYGVRNKVINKVDHDKGQIEVEEIPANLKSLLKAYLGLNNYILDEIKLADEIWDITEGDSFSDIYGIKRYIHFSIIKLIAIHNKKKLIIMPQTLGPYKRWWIKRLTTKIINRAYKVFARDEISKDIVEKDLKVKKRIEYIPDMAFYMNPSKDISISRFIKDDKSIKVGINVSALLYNGGYNGKNMFNLRVDYKKLIDNILNQFTSMDNVKVILIPHVMTKELEVEDDFKVCEKIADEYNKKSEVKIHTVDKYYREDELKAIISGCDFFIGSRMHACIGAISTLVPTAPIAYSRKFIGIWDKIKLGYCITDPRKETEEEIINKILESFNNRNSIKEKLSIEIPKLKSKIEGIVEVI